METCVEGRGCKCDIPDTKTPADDTVIHYDIMVPTVPNFSLTCSTKRTRTVAAKWYDVHVCLSACYRRLRPVMAVYVIVYNMVLIFPDKIHSPSAVKSQIFLNDNNTQQTFTVLTSLSNLSPDQLVLNTRTCCNVIIETRKVWDVSPFAIHRD